jgi:integrase
MNTDQDPEPSGAARQRRSRSRHAGSISHYTTRDGQRWKFQIYAPRDPGNPELGDTRVTRGGFKTLDEAQKALAEAIRKRARDERFQGTTPTLGAYAELWIAGLRLENSTVVGYRKIIRNHIAPKLGELRLDKLTSTRIAAHYRLLEASGRRDSTGFGKPLSANSVNKVHVVLGPVPRSARSDPRSRPGRASSYRRSWSGTVSRSTTSSSRSGGRSPTPGCAAAKPSRCAGVT